MTTETKTIAVPYEEAHDALFLRVSMASAEHPDYEVLEVSSAGSAVVVGIQRTGEERRQYVVPVEELLRAFMDLEN